MKLLSLKEFQALCAISDSALANLLRENLVRCVVDPERGLLIDVDSASVSSLIQALREKRSSLREAEHKLLSEKASRIIRENLDQILDEAIGTYLLKSGS